MSSWSMPGKCWPLLLEWHWYLNIWSGHLTHLLAIHLLPLTTGQPMWWFLLSRLPSLLNDRDELWLVSYREYWAVIGQLKRMLSYDWSVLPDVPPEQSWPRSSLHTHSCSIKHCPPPLLHPWQPDHDSGQSGASIVITLTVHWVIQTWTVVIGQ